MRNNNYQLIFVYCMLDKHLDDLTLLSSPLSDFAALPDITIEAFVESNNYLNDISPVIDLVYQRQCKCFESFHSTSLRPVDIAFF